MVGIIHKVKVGPKGQIVIPKIFRDNFGILPGREVILEYEEGKLAIKQNGETMHELAARIAKGRTNKLTAKEMRELAYEQ